MKAVVIKMYTNGIERARERHVRGESETDDAEQGFPKSRVFKVATVAIYTLFL